MLETFDIDEILFEEKDMLSIKGDCFYCIEIICAFFITFSYNAMRSLTNLITQSKLVFKYRMKFILIVQIAI